MPIDFLGLPVRLPFLAIFRGLTPEESVRAAQDAWDLGIELVEVPIQSPSAVAAAEAVIRAGHERGMPVGTGTVMTGDQVRASAALGAAFTVAPGFDAEVARVSAEVGLPHLPGVASATELQLARRAGCIWVKAFPAEALGPHWFTAMKRGPFPDASFVATGGVNGDNAADFLAAGASIVALGSSLLDPPQRDRVQALIQSHG
jgi:2-dehydro-3-deoxyphosphogluconate aldolase/(4S)-4-hydroxy-2-oxoglutarate aldolase